MDIEKLSNDLMPFLFWGGDSDENDNEVSRIKKVLGEFHCLFIAIDDYSWERGLTYAVNDAESLLGLWEKVIPVQKLNIYRLYNDQATKANIISNLERLRKKIGPTDRLIIHFSGHGIMESTQQFFIPSDGNRRNRYSCISSEVMNGYIRNIHSNQALLILNACQTGLTENQKTFPHIFPFQVDRENSNESARAIKKGLYGRSTIFTRIIDFLNKEEKNRHKDLFVFFRNQTEHRFRNEATDSYIQSDVSYLESTIKNTYDQINQLIIKEELQHAIRMCMAITQNNNQSLYDDFRSLLYTIFKIQKEIRELGLRAIGDSELNASMLDTKERLYETRKKIGEVTKSKLDEIKGYGFFVQWLPEGDSGNALPNPPKTKILMASADASDHGHIRLDIEFREVRSALMLSGHGDKFDIQTTLATRAEDFAQDLIKHKPQFMHFAGHGTCSGIYLLSNDGRKQIVKNEPLAKLFSLMDPHIQCVFFKLLPFNSPVAAFESIRPQGGMHEQYGEGRDGHQICVFVLFCPWQWRNNRLFI